MREMVCAYVHHWWLRRGRVIYQLQNKPCVNNIYPSAIPIALQIRICFKQALSAID